MPSLDPRGALRRLARAPLFSAVVFTTIALSTGVVTGVFSVVDAVERGARPYPARDRVVVIEGRVVRKGDAFWPLSYLDVDAMRREAGTFDLVGGHSFARSFNLVTDGVADHVEGELVSPEFFAVLGLRPVVGRLFRVEEERAPGARAVAVLGHRFWRGRMGGRRDVVGRTVRLNDVDYEVVGVLPAGFRGLSDDADVWLPLGRAREMYVAGYTDVRQFRWLGAVARLSPGMDVARAQASLDALALRLEATFPRENEDLRMRVLPLEERVGGEVRPQLRLLLAGAGILFAIAVTNLGGLCLVRAAARRREYAIRAALGASPLRVLGAPALDVALLAVLGLAAGAALAAWVAPLLAERQAFGLPAFVGVAPSWRVWAIAALAVTACAAVLVLAPLTVIRRAPATELAGGGRGGSGAAGAARLLDVLTGLEACLATVLLVCAALLFRGLQRHLATDLGFAREAVATARLDLTGERYRSDERVWTLVRQATDGLRAVPGARRVAFEGPSLPTGGFYGVHLRASERPASDPDVMGNRHQVSPDYFATLEIPLRQGRAFGDADIAGAPRVVVLSESMARRLWPGAEAVGRRLVTIGGQKTNEWTVVGVVADVRHAGLRDADSSDPDVYFPLLQTAPRSPSLLNVLVAHGTSPYDATADGVRRAIAAVDPLLPLFDARPLEDRLREQTARGRFLATLAGVLGAGALLLAVLGIYGAVAYRTLSEQRLFAIRLALGATSGTVFAFACRRALLPIAVGIATGLALFALLTTPLRTQLYGLPALDPVALGAALGAVLATAALAVIVPAWRIARTPPVRVLAGE